MRKMLSIIMMMIMVLSLALTGCGKDDAKKGSEQASFETSQESSESVETEESTMENSTETEVESTEEVSDIEAVATTIMEEYKVEDEAIKNYILQQLEWLTNKSGDDTKEYDRLLENLKLEVAELVANPTTEEDTEKREINWVEENLPAEREWVDDLYNKLVSDDYEAVIDILLDTSLVEKLTPYEYSYNSATEEIAYRLVTMDGKYVGIILPEELNEQSSRFAFYSESEISDYGFESINVGDHSVTYRYDYINEQLTYEWFDGTTIHRKDGSTATVDDVYIVWSM